MPPGVIQVPNLATLELLAPSTRVTDGCLAYVQTLKRCFELDRSSADAPIAGQRVSATGGGVWRSTSYYSPEAGPWTARTDWHIDATSGSVEGDGSASSPLSSWLELMTRLNDQQMRGLTTISLHTPLGEVIDASRFSLHSSGLLIAGDAGATTVVGGNVTTYTNESLVGSGSAPDLTSAAVADWTAYEGLRIRFTSGPAAGCWSNIAKANPNGTGVQHARLPAPVMASLTNPTFPVPLADNAWVVETLPQVAGYIAPRGIVTQPATLQGVSLADVVSPTRHWIMAGPRTVLWGCTLGDVTITGERIDIHGCRIGSSAYPEINGQSVFYYGCTFRKIILKTMYSNSDHNVYQGGVTVNAGNNIFHHAGAFDTVGLSGVMIGGPGTWVYFFGTFYGQGNARYGVELPAGGCGANYSSKPIVTGTLGNARIAGVNYAWADIPVVATNLSGIVTP